jgi:hypothetical protein
MSFEGFVMSIDRTGAAPGGSESTPEPLLTPLSSPLVESTDAQLARTRRELDALRATHSQMMELIGCNKPEKLVHDLRNVLNELQLLRLLSDSGKC